MRTLILAAILVSARGAVVDRIAVVVGNDVITQSEVDEEVRVTEFLNQQPLDLSAEQRRAAAERLVDQQLIRNEMEISNFSQPQPSEADSLLQKYRQEQYLSIAQFRAALTKYGITEDQLKQHLLWQATAIQFTEARFRPGAGLPPATPAPAQAANRMRRAPTPPVQTADRLSSGSGPAPPPVSASSGGTVDQQMDAWLQQTRSQTRIDFKKEAFQ